MVIFMEKKMITKIVTICLIVITLSPIVTLTVQSQMIGGFSDFAINSEDSKLYKVLLYKKGVLGNFLSSDTYHFQMKADTTYLLRTKIAITQGAFSLYVNGPGGDHLEIRTWDTNDPKSSRVIEFLFTPSAAGDHSITVFVSASNDGGDYSLYANQEGFAGWWWILASGIGVLLLIVIIFVVISRAAKPKRKGKKRRR